MRFTSVWTTARRSRRTAEHGQGVDDGLPVEPVGAEAEHEHPQQRGERRAALHAEAMKPMTGVGEPW